MVKATLLPIKASHITMIRGKKETKEIEKQIDKDLAGKKLFKITS
jgi:hypothetical protein